MRIGELSSRSGLSRDALRFYEKRGLLRARRGANGYRDYPPEAADWLRYLRTAQQLGFADELVSLGIKINAMHIHEGGEELVKLALGEIGEGLSPYPFVLSLPQDEHERFLISKLAAAGVHVEWNVALDLWTQDDSEVQAILLKDDERQYCTFDYICGCDGARSKVREIAGVDFSGGTYNHLYYVADAQVAGSNTDLHAHLGANAFALMLPVRTSGMRCRMDSL